jgi:hypothetical protein
MRLSGDAEIITSHWPAVSRFLRGDRVVDASLISREAEVTSIVGGGRRQRSTGS